MKKFFCQILKSIFTISLSLIILVSVVSLKTNLSFTTTLTYLKSIARETLNINIPEEPPLDFEEELILTSSNNSYYYIQLDNNAKIIYAALENNIDNLLKENYIINFYTTFNNLLNTTTGKYKLNKAFQSALDAFFYDHPELFYLDMTKIILNTTCVSIGNTKTYTVEIRPIGNTYLRDDFNTESDAIIAIMQVENIKNNIINEVSQKNIYNQIKEVHDILVNMINYDSTYQKSNTHSIYGALIEKQVVCEGYAKAFKYIMDGLNVECILIAGTSISPSGETESHMWNYVKLNNNWYGVDVTWDDPIINGGSVKDNLRHDFFMKGKTAFRDTHEPSGKISNEGMLFSLPILSDNNYKK